MSTFAATIAHILDTLADLPLSSRKMFGEYALYLEGKTVAFVCDDTLSTGRRRGRQRFCPMPSAAQPIRAARITSSGQRRWTTPTCASAPCVRRPQTRRHRSQRKQR